MEDKIVFAKQVARLLRTLSEKIEENPELLNELGLEVPLSLLAQSDDSFRGSSADLDIFGIYLEKGPKELRERLKSLPVESLKAMLEHHSFDPSRFADKWNDRERIMDLIVKRVASRINGPDRL